MQFVSFTAFDYNSDDSFSRSVYEMEGSEESGWKIQRNALPYLELGKGYRLVKTELCGICSTDLDRRFLPFALPQVIGHEVLVSDPLTHKKYVLEINDTVAARGEETDPFCNIGIPTHSPTRMVLGIDRLPGGFGPYILAPVGTLVETGSLKDKEAVLLEPFAASLHGVEVSLDRRGRDLPQKIAVLGARRLGSLVIAALDLYRKRKNLSYEIVSILRHEDLKELSLSVGADKVFYFSNLGKEETEIEKTIGADTKMFDRSEEALLGKVFDRSKIEPKAIKWADCKDAFDLVFDTTGSVSGLETAMYLTAKEIHRKTTNGQASLGISHLTEMVVDEISITYLRSDLSDLIWGIQETSPTWIYISSQTELTKEEQIWIDQLKTQNKYKFFVGSIQEADEFLHSTEFDGALPHFDFAIIGSSSELDPILRPKTGIERSLVRPRGSVLISQGAKKDPNPFAFWILSGGILSSSRCGDFHRTRELLESEPGFLHTVSEALISGEYDSQSIPEAYLAARKSENIKVIVRHGAS
ncbi:zinc-binding alcohol dehydrogenase [Leptospira semungkisensis]|uniref:Zinc-binding alcohol dehydrogenase n=1 Tax=Leptospira semungkisensis TaxID=2484985 RepID=A0A4R9G638_9LEPT|nr:alcohol dehydrogenase catalytic domain-containing protein [Leptospira semungkisensis]TGK07032.1 zinc-binding alcohol dehydrogenase [Leptospira semungkisensis]